MLRLYLAAARSSANLGGYNIVIAGLDPAIHGALPHIGESAWTTGSSPVVTSQCERCFALIVCRSGSKSA
jgi:hypothetical protein